MDSSLQRTTVAMPDGTVAIITKFTRGYKKYNLTDHRNNNMAEVSDKKIQVSINNVTVSGYLPDVVTAQDYSSFGALLEGRQY
jgi:hypothetical protein